MPISRTAEIVQNIIDQFISFPSGRTTEIWAACVFFTLLLDSRWKTRSTAIFAIKFISLAFAALVDVSRIHHRTTRQTT